MARDTRKPDTTPDDKIDGKATLHERVGEWLAADEWRYSESEDGDWYSVPVSLEAGTARVIVETCEEGDRSQLIMVCLFPVNIPMPRRQAMAEFVCRINFVTRLGALELDWTYGEIRQRLAADLIETSFNQATFDRMLRRTLQMANRAYAPILSVGFGEVAPEAAFAALQAAVEQERHEREGAVLQ